MDPKNNQDTPPDDEWHKTISDAPIPESELNSLPASQSPYSTAKMPSDKAGEILGSGTIVCLLGEGGMARVYKIWNDALEMHRAVKVLLPTGKKEISDRFVTEARITARLNHPNIVSVLGVGDWKGYPLIEMEFIDGMSLELLLEKRGAFPAYAACAAGIFIARALSHAHVLEYTLYGKHYTGVIHRDLKPANIMVHTDGRLKIMDFGIARPISSGLNNTMAGNIVGTLPYLSPEQLNSEPIDHRTDIYAVGAVLYELLSGIKAFPDDRLTTLFRNKTGGIYKRFGEIPLSVPAKLTEIVDTCLKVEKTDRYSDAEALCNALSAVYTQITEERPEAALKKYLDDPKYTPAASAVKTKKKSNHQPLRFPRWILPKPQLSNLRQFFLNALKGADTAATRFFGRFRTGSAATATRIKLFSRRGYAIASAASGVAVLLVIVMLFVTHQNKDRTVSTKAPSPTPLQEIADSPKDTATPAFQPIIISPGINEILQSETLTVFWRPISGAKSYTIHLAATDEFSDTIYRQTISGDTSFTLTDLKPGDYCCRLGVTDGSGGFIWSPPRCFNRAPAPDTPEPIVPANGKNCSSREVTFKWKNVEKVRLYRITIAVDSSFKRVIFDSSGCKDTTITVLFSDTASERYFWHVQAHNKSEDPWSATYSFTISDKRDYGALIASALQNKKLAEAEKNLQKLPASDFRKDTLVIRLAEKYLETGNIEKADAILKASALRDMLVDYLESRILYAKGNYPAALAFLDAAIYSKTQFTSWEDSSNVIYWRAAVTQKLYDGKKDKKIGIKAYYAWDSVKKRFATNPSHDRYRDALTNMNKLYYSENVFRLNADSLKKHQKR